MMKKRSFSASLSSVCGYVENLEGRCLLTLIPLPLNLNVSPGDVNHLVVRRSVDKFIPSGMKGVVSLNSSLDTYSQHDDTVVVGMEDMQLTAAQMEMWGSLVGRISTFTVNVDTSIIKTSVSEDAVMAQDTIRVARAVVSISGWGHLDLRVHAYASTSHIKNDSYGTFESGVYSSTHETDEQITEADFDIEADGKFQVIFTVTARASEMNLGANLAPDETSGNVAISRSEVSVYVQATRYNLSGTSWANTTRDTPDHTYDENYAKAEVGLYARGQGTFYSHAEANRKTITGYDKGVTWSSETRPEIQVTGGSSVRGEMTYHVTGGDESSFINNPAKTVKLKLGLREVWSSILIPVGENTGNVEMLDRVFQDYLDLSRIISNSIPPS